MTCSSLISLIVPDPVVTIALFVGIMITDFHHVYWIESLSRKVKVSKGWIITILRMVEGISAFIFLQPFVCELLSKVVDLYLANMTSATVSLIVIAVVVIQMLRRDKILDYVQANELEQARARFHEELKGYPDMMVKAQEQFLSTLETRHEKWDSRLLRLDIITNKTTGMNDAQFKASSEILAILRESQEILSRVFEKEESLDFQREMMEARTEDPADITKDSEKQEKQQQDQEQEQDEQISTKLTAEQGRTNREKGYQSQKELAEMVRTWNIKVIMGYNKEKPDIIVTSDDGQVAAIIACKSYTLCEVGGSAKQRSIAKSDILAEYRYAKKKDLPLVIAVKNLVTGRWWMKWISAEELKEFETVTTPVILTEDSAEAIKALEESVSSVREKLVGVA